MSLKWLGILSLLFWSIVAMATLSEPDRAIITIRNLLTNGGFENGKAQWVASVSGHFTLTTTAANVAIGNQAGAWDTTAANERLETGLIETPSGLFGAPGVASCKLKGQGTALFQVYDDDTSSLLVSQQMVGSDGFQQNTVNFLFPATDDNIKIRLFSTTTTDPVIYVDDCYLGSAVGFNVYTTQIVNDVTGVFVWAPQNFGTVTANTAFTKRVGDVADVTTIWTSGTTVAATAGILLPPGLTIDLSKISPDHQNIGTCFDKNDASAPIFPTNGLSQIVFSDGSTDNELFIAYQDGSNVFLKGNGNNLANTGDAITCNFKVPIKQWAGSDLAFTPEKVANSWSGYHHNDCDFSFAGSNNTYHDPSTSNCTFSERTNRNFGLVSSAGSPGALLPGIVFTPSRAGTYHVCVTVPTYQFTGGVLTSYRIWDGTTTVATTQGIISSTVPNMYGSAAMCGDYVANSTAPVTLSIQGATDDSTAIHLESGAGSNDAGASVVEWTIFQVDQVLPMPLIFSPVIAKAHGVPAAASAGDPIIYPTVSYDTTGAYNPTTGQFTCPTSNYYSVQGAITASNQFGVYTYVNGVQDTLVGFAPSTSGSTSFAGTSFCPAGQTLDIRTAGAGTGSPGDGAVSFILIR